MSIFVVAMVTVIDNVMFAVHSMSKSFPSESDQAQKEEEEEEGGWVLIKIAV